jgi:hypothetical protein
MTDDRLTTSDLASSDTPEDAAGDTAADGRQPEGDGTGKRTEPLLPTDQAGQYTARWEKIQSDFVDEPRESVEEADALVADLMQRLASSFAEERKHLEGQWDRGDEVSTEDLRVALTRYRSFFERLLSA